MKRWSLALITLVPLALVACEDKNKKPAAKAEPAPENSGVTDIGPITTPPGTSDPYATDPMITPRGSAPAYTTPAPAPAATQYEELPPVTPRSTARPAPADSPPPIAEPAPRGGRVHVVARGETLSSISKQYYGTANRWREIWDANRGKVPDPKRMKVGTRLVIP
jgi:nucleoid-associated protein YgaU